MGDVARNKLIVEEIEEENIDPSQTKNKILTNLNSGNDGKRKRSDEEHGNDNGIIQVEEEDDQENKDKIDQNNNNKNNIGNVNVNLAEDVQVTSSPPKQKLKLVGTGDVGANHPIVVLEDDRDDDEEIQMYAETTNIKNINSNNNHTK